MKKFIFQCHEAIINKRESKKVYLFGAGKDSLLMLENLFSDARHCGIDFAIDGVYDSDRKKVGSYFWGHKIKGIKELQELSLTKSLFLIGTYNQRYIEEITYTLEKMGFQDICYNYFEGFTPCSPQIVKNYFNEHIEKVNKIYDHLGDDKSKIIFDGIYETRTNYNINRKLIFRQMYLLSKENGSRQYFPNIDVFCKENESIFVDVGAMNGENTLDFVSWSNNNYKGVLLFECDNRQIPLIETKMILYNVKNTLVYPFALADRKEQLTFARYGGGASRLQDKGEYVVEAVRLDDIEISLKERISFIKMDIEGAEMNALRGADQVIRKWQPKLAISVYHNYNDIIDIPYKLINDYNYKKIFLRHYSTSAYETVCYACS